MKATPVAEGTTPSLALVALGAVAGVLSGLFGIGGGIVMVPAMVLLLGFIQRRANATSLAAILPISVVGATLFGRANNIDVLAAVVLSVGSLIGVQGGARAMDRLSDRRLGLIFGAFLVALALAMLFL